MKKITQEEWKTLCNLPYVCIYENGDARSICGVYDFRLKQIVKRLNEDFPEHVQYTNSFDYIKNKRFLLLNINLNGISTIMKGNK